jgi:hypothetical protein
MRLQLASLLAAREVALKKTNQEDSSKARVQRLLALATLYEATDRPADAQKRLLEAAGSLAEPSTNDGTVAQSLALADCYERLSALSSSRDQAQSRKYLEQALAVRRGLAMQYEDDALVQSSRVDSELRVASQSGDNDPMKEIADAKELLANLRQAWPETPAEIYRVACWLAGRRPYLSETNSSGAPIKAR